MSNRKKFVDIAYEVGFFLLMLVIAAGAIYTICTAVKPVPAKAASIAGIDCPVEAMGVRWDGVTDKYTIYLANPTRSEISVNKFELGVYVGADTGDVPDPANMRWVTIVVPTTKVAPMAVTPVNFDAPNVDPQAVDGRFRVECSVV